jgi:hypothetical protein
MTIGWAVNLYSAVLHWPPAGGAAAAPDGTVGWGTPPDRTRLPARFSQHAGPDATLSVTKGAGHLGGATTLRAHLEAKEQTGRGGFVGVGDVGVLLLGEDGGEHILVASRPLDPHGSSSEVVQVDVALQVCASSGVLREALREVLRQAGHPERALGDRHGGQCEVVEGHLRLLAPDGVPMVHEVIGTLASVALSPAQTAAQEEKLMQMMRAVEALGHAQLAALVRGSLDFLVDEAQLHTFSGDAGQLRFMATLQEQGLRFSSTGQFFRAVGEQHAARMGWRELPMPSLQPPMTP